ncbi:hypothetical protein ATO8_20289 [Roseivivax marinus]|uniref:Uncharacterized protein n=1 Tax=Roseivivax marinus TaxID=1379903 RepID=W4HFA6_9RHOB|nr:hypothetical protein [Roseivivax marinus]ETW10831.1 hypothetical protein ATO8_20289 [Roseivivax marinus]
MSKKKLNPQTAIESGRARIDGKLKDLTDDQREIVLSMIAARERPEVLNATRLAPEGSVLSRVLRLVDNTNISYTLALAQIISLAAAWLTQNGARLSVPGLGTIRPTLWSIALGDSADCKTLASTTITRILRDSTGDDPVQMLPDAGSDAQWIEELAAHNGSHWYQDEVGQYVRKVLTDARFSRMKPWILNAYSSEPIANRLKGEDEKLQIDDPHYTFLGLTVGSTWHNCLDAESVLDGFLQRFNYFIATPRADKDAFDHFLFFADPESERVSKDIGDIWSGLIAQRGAAAEYTLGPDILPYLERWWGSLRGKWGNCPLPVSYTRRIGFSVLRYLVVLHWLLGKSGHPIDLETAELATRYGEYHLEAALCMLRMFDENPSEKYCTILDVRDRLIARGRPAEPRNIVMSLSAAQRRGISTSLVRSVLSVADRVDSTGLIGSLKTAKNGAPRCDRAALNERKRNEARIQRIRQTASRTDPFSDAVPPSANG